jgi:hypothetical protein
VEYEPRAIKARSVKNGHVALKERCETTGALAKLILRSILSKIAVDGEDGSSIAIEILTVETCAVYGTFVLNDIVVNL